MDLLSRAALDFFQCAASVTSFNELIEGFADVAQAAGFSGAACFHVASPGHPIAPRLLFSWSIPDRALRQLERRFVRPDDVVSALFMSSGAIPLSALEAPSDAAASRTPAGGLVVPVHGPQGDIMCVVVLGGPDEALAARTRMTLQTAATLLANQGAALVEVESDPSQGPHPSRREAQCARLAFNGKSDWEIGRILGVSEDAVALHFERLKSKLGVTRRAQIPQHVWRNVEHQDE